MFRQSVLYWFWQEFVWISEKSTSFKDFKSPIIYLSIMGVLIAGMHMAIPVIFKNVVEEISSGSSVSQLTILVTSYCSIQLFLRVLSELRWRYSGAIDCWAQSNILQRVFRHTMGLDFGFHENRSLGEMGAVLSKSLTASRQILLSIFLIILPMFLEFFFLGWMILYFFDGLFLTVFFLSVGSYLLVLMVGSEWLYKQQKVAQMSEKGTVGSFVDTLLGYQSIRLFRTEAFQYSKFKKIVTDTMEKSLSTWERRSIFGVVQAVIISGGIGSIFVLSVYYYRLGHISMGSLIFINMYFFLLVRPLEVLGFTYREMKRFVVDLEHLKKLFSVKSEVTFPTEMQAVLSNQRGLYFKGVTHAYPGNAPALEDVSFKVMPGQSVALVGHSGAGKSTLLKLLMRFYQLQRGEILIDGRPIETFSKEALSQKISVVPQDSSLLRGTFYENILMGNPDASQDQVVKAAKRALIHDVIMGTADGYETEIGEGGVKLSGGQKQRIAIARALLRSAPILILDEATSGLDLRTENILLAPLLKGVEERTLIIMSHRLSSIRSVDHIVVLENGRVVEEGNHESLIPLRGAYHELWTSQLEEKREFRGLPQAYMPTWAV
ncbi:MAG: ABC transporter ATP-binding protein [Alphaproteobacteria bacterium]|nr:ABC transporter ATP-binding protein [Alphaproteobacteria bacterium]